MLINKIDNENGTLARMVSSIVDQNAKAVDYHANTGLMEFRSGPGDFRLKSFLKVKKGEPTRTLSVNDVCFTGLAKSAEIDIRTARRFASSYPQEFDALVNAIWQKEPKQKTLRTFMENDHIGTARAFLSDSFKLYDNIDILQTSLPVLHDSPNEWIFENGHITEKEVYGPFPFSAHYRHGANVGDLMALGLLIANSETGHGSVQIAQITFTLACKNGMQTENRVRTPHLGSSRGDKDVWSIMSPEAKSGH